MEYQCKGMWSRLPYSCWQQWQMMLRPGQHHCCQHNHCRLLLLTTPVNRRMRSIPFHLCPNSHPPAPIRRWRLPPLFLLWLTKQMILLAHLHIDLHLCHPYISHLTLSFTLNTSLYPGRLTINPLVRIPWLLFPLIIPHNLRHLIASQYPHTIPSDYIVYLQMSLHLWRLLSMPVYLWRERSLIQTFTILPDS